MTVLRPDSPAAATITPRDSGGLQVDVDVPTYGGGARFTVSVDRSPDGDWVVSIPWPDTDDDRPVMVDDMECSTGSCTSAHPTSRSSRRSTEPTG